MTLTAEGPCLELEDPLKINITLLQCPTGFMLSNTTKGCTCEKTLQKYTNKCIITSRKIHRDSEFWVGVDSGFGGTILHPNCPFDYCKSHPVSFTLNETDREYSYYRTGLLCGGCQQGLSNVLGSSRCIKCSGTYLPLLIPFALTGIALVAFLLLCRLTVIAGSINGLIIDANILAVCFHPTQCCSSVDSGYKLTMKSGYFHVSVTTESNHSLMHTTLPTGMSTATGQDCC